jgi:hypothetical protein
MPRKPNIPPCSNCKLEGGAYVAVSRAADGKSLWLPHGFVSGFLLECSHCNARSPPFRSKASCLRAWKRGRVVSQLERAREERIFAAIEAEISEQRFRSEDMPRVPWPPSPDDDIPF